MYEKYLEFNFKKRPLFKYFLNSDSMPIKLLNLLGKRIDLNLANIDRFPKDKVFNYLKKRGFEKYIRKNSI